MRAFSESCPALVLSGGMAAASPFSPVVRTCYRNEFFTMLATGKHEEVVKRFLVHTSPPVIKTDRIVEQRPNDRMTGAPSAQDEMEAFFYITRVKSFLILDSGARSKTIHL